MDRVHHVVNSLFSSKTYRFGNAIVDPGDVWDGFNGISSVLLTHAHFDHIYGLNELLIHSPEAKVYTNEYGKAMLLDARKNMSFYNDTPFVIKCSEKIVTVEDCQEIEINIGVIAKAVFTPGHNPSCITWVIDDIVFSGDSLIPGIKTVTNLPGGNRQQANESEELIRHLAVGRTLYPGHII